MGDLFDTAEGLLGRRRLVGLWLPMLVFAAGILAVVAIGVGSQRLADWWDDQPGVARTVIGVAALAGAVLAAEIVAAVRPAAFRVYRGSWSSERLTARQFRRADPERPWLSPAHDRMRPTRLGNVLVAAEQEAERYGMDAATAWPRLYPVLPDAFTMLFGQAASRLELMVTVSLLGMVFAVAGGVLAAVLCPWYVTAAVIAIGLLAAWSGYQGAVHAGVRYGNLVRSAFDVHRWLLLDAMGLTRPQSYAAELKQWQQLHQLWQRGRPDSGEAHHLGYPGDGAG